MKSLVLDIRFLTGRYVATTYNEREKAEWPPHPARLYSALLATWADYEVQTDEERAALKWLAALDPPSLYASGASERDVVPHFVPVNDVAVLKEFSDDKLVNVEEQLAAAVAQREVATTAGDQKALARSSKEVCNQEKALSKARSTMADDKLKDQQVGKISKEAIKNARALLPDQRLKQQRFFPSVTPHEARVCVMWSAPKVEVEQHAPVLGKLAADVVRLGHSSSFVSCSVVDSAPPPTWEPNDLGDAVFRVPGAGQLERLEEAHQLHGGVEPRVLPCRFQRYRAVGAAPASEILQSVFDDDWIVFRQRSGRRLSQTNCVELAQAVRDALIERSADPKPEVISGKAASGAPSQAPHVALVPLPFVGYHYSTGEILGFAIVPPRGLSDSARLDVLQAIANWENERRAHLGSDAETPTLTIHLQRAGALEVERVEWGEGTLASLSARSWCRPSRTWVTATPIALDRNPGDLRSRDPRKSDAAFLACQESIALACQRIGLPTPSLVEVHPSVSVTGGAKARCYPRFPVDSNREQRVTVHASISFPSLVSGPLLLGAGRYLGLGLCLPVVEGKRIAL